MSDTNKFSVIIYKEAKSKGRSILKPNKSTFSKLADALKAVEKHKLSGKLKIELENQETKSKTLFFKTLSEKNYTKKVMKL